MQNNKIIRYFQIFLSTLIALFLAVVLLPFVLVFAFAALIVVFIYSYRKKNPPVKPKGTIEILMPEKPPEPPLKATTDKDLEITIEALQNNPPEEKK